MDRNEVAAAVMFVVGMATLASAIFVPRSIPRGILTVSILGYLVMFDAALRWFQGALHVQNCLSDSAIRGVRIRKSSPRSFPAAQMASVLPNRMLRRRHSDLSRSPEFARPCDHGSSASAQQPTLQSTTSSSVPLVECLALGLGGALDRRHGLAWTLPRSACGSSLRRGGSRGLGAYGQGGRMSLLAR